MPLCCCRKSSIITSDQLDKLREPENYLQRVRHLLPETLVFPAPLHCEFHPSSWRGMTEKHG